MDLKDISLKKIPDLERRLEVFEINEDCLRIIGRFLEKKDGKPYSNLILILSKSDKSITILGEILRIYSKDRIRRVTSQRIHGETEIHLEYDFDGYFITKYLIGKTTLNEEARGWVEKANSFYEN